MSQTALLIRCNELALELGISNSTLFRWRQNGEIPKPIYLGPRIVAWERAQIDQWLASKRNPAKKTKK
ncbi:AlpA family phage regulatory protein [Vibrio fluvialis]|uniref:helix-turn-helix transcriptional regulator n=1 Tax=Vibrio TaxID=662 RepID=UPI001C9BD17F|nr:MULTISPECIES: AlpA family phage regulatory protein [Vibrio]EKO5124767.1 AlpA family phage regulatory protein [Vibrio fluvialis]MBY7911345.1 AlpA family phage regulatory protein [Vibrio fluvialis]MBY7954301.1 AlpA family phage regulatory protein [Vibrio fluvialis]MBY8065417.1 AlpA family phage regulatory protein [Vibrio fluvialis]MBY8134261.1 AlpA family phage regulatory protein [Vibrio fluvialis]